MLAFSDWIGGTYRALFHTESELAQYLDGIPVGIVVLGGDCRSREHGRLLSDTTLHHPEKWALCTGHARGATQLTCQNDILVYRLIGHKGRSVGRIAIPMQFAQYDSFGIRFPERDKADGTDQTRSSANGIPGRQAPVYY